MKKAIALILVFVYSMTMSGLLSSAHACCSGEWTIFHCSEEQATCCGLEDFDDEGEVESCGSNDECECPEAFDEHSPLDIIQLIDSEKSTSSTQYVSSCSEIELSISSWHGVVKQSELSYHHSSPPKTSKAIRLLMCSLVYYA